MNEHLFAQRLLPDGSFIMKPVNMTYEELLDLKEAAKRNSYTRKDTADEGPSISEFLKLQQSRDALAKQGRSQRRKAPAVSNEKRLIDVGTAIMNFELSQFPPHRPIEKPSGDQLVILENVMLFAVYLNLKLGQKATETIFGNIADVISTMTGVSKNTANNAMGTFNILKQVEDWEVDRVLLEDNDVEKNEEPLTKKTKAQSPKYENSENVRLPSEKPLNTSQLTVQEDFVPSYDSIAAEIAEALKPATQSIQSQQAKPPRRKRTDFRQYASRLDLKKIFGKRILVYPSAIFEWEQFVFDSLDFVNSYTKDKISWVLNDLKESGLLYEVSNTGGYAEKKTIFIKETRTAHLGNLCQYGITTAQYIETLIDPSGSLLLEQFNTYDPVFDIRTKIHENHLNSILMLAVIQSPSIELTSVIENLPVYKRTEVADTLENLHFLDVQRSGPGQLCSVRKSKDVLEYPDFLARFGISPLFYSSLVNFSDRQEYSALLNTATRAIGDNEKIKDGEEQSYVLMARPDLTDASNDPFFNQNGSEMIEVKQEVDDDE